ncbi:MAG: SCO family protein [Longimicrobiales bacterium]|nr:SCO family protein [Longimicrobiales bacterium]
MRSRPLPAPRRALVALALAAAVTACSGPPAPPDPGSFAGVGLPGAVTLPDLEIEVDPGVRSSLPERLTGAVNLVFVGYTYCPDICPVHLANLGAVLRDLPLEISREVEVAFVTADPARDTHARIDAWLRALDPRFEVKFHGFRPTRDEVNALEDALGIPRSVVDPEGADGEYFVAHAGQVIAFDEAGRARAAYPWGIRQRDWHADLPRLVRGEWPPLGDDSAAELR